MDELLRRLEVLREQAALAWSETATGPALTAVIAQFGEDMIAHKGGNVTWRIRKLTRLLEELAFDVQLESQLCQALLGELKWQRLYDAQGLTTWARAA